MAIFVGFCALCGVGISTACTLMSAQRTNERFFVSHEHRTTQTTQHVFHNADVQGLWQEVQWYGDVADLGVVMVEGLVV
jgi:hypothetical protein